MHDPVLWPSLRCQHGPLVTADDRQRTDCQAGRQDMLLRERQGCVPYPALAPCLWRLHADRCAHAYPTPASGGARLGERARADDAELHACPGFHAQRAIADVRGPQQPQLCTHACVAGVVRVPRGCGGASGGSLGGPARVALGLGGRPAPPALVAAHRERVPAAAGGVAGVGAAAAERTAGRRAEARGWDSAQQGWHTRRRGSLPGAVLQRGARAAAQ